ncbi:MAG: hypothetical protein AAF658_14505, partial [Myxococcota bacterium]
TAEEVSLGFDAGGCEAGDLTAEARASGLRQINMFRWLNGLDPVPYTTDESVIREVQECAFVLGVNRALTHNPPETFTCYTEGAARAAAQSNIARDDPNYSVFNFMFDPGAHNYQVGHRRFFISPRLGSVAIGAVPNGDGIGRASCVHVHDRSGSGTSRPFLAFPNPGVAPIEQLRGLNSDEAPGRWSVSMGERGEDDALSSGDVVHVYQLPERDEVLIHAEPENDGFFSSGGFAFPGALVWKLDVNPVAGESYEVVVERDGDEFLSYEVNLVSCGGRWGNRP